MDQFVEYLKNISFNPLIDIIEILLLAVGIYYTALYIKKLNAHWYNKLLFVLILVGVILGVSDLKMARAVFGGLVSVIILSTVIIFAQDIKRGVWKLSRPRKKAAEQTRHENDFSDDDLRQSVAELVRAMQSLAKKNVGALIIFSRTAMPTQIIESGVSIDAKISSQIIETLFFRNTALHDGAVIITENRIVAAGCFLPLSVDTNLPKDLGTRHRAALGVSEAVSDAVALSVSEETGIISLAYQGKIYRYLDTDQLTVSVEAAIGLRELDEMPFFAAAAKEEVLDAEKQV